MARFINRITNTEMWVADERIEEYTAAGHTLVAEAPVAIEPTVVEEPKKVATKKKTYTKK